MAVMKLSGLVSGIQGKINGSVISIGRSGTVFYNKPTQRKEPTAAQLGIRGGFSGASFGWSSLSPEQKEDWATIADAHPVPNKFGDIYPLSAFMYYKKMMGLTYPIGSPGAIVPDTSNAPAYEFTIDESGAQAELTAAGYLLIDFGVAIRITSDSTEINRGNLYISLPVRSLTDPYFKTWYLVESFEIDANLGVDAVELKTGSDKVMSSGWRTFDGALHLMKFVAFIPDMGTISVEQIAPFPISIIPPVEFPVLSPASSPINSIFLIDTPGVFGYAINLTVTPPGFYSDYFTWVIQFAAPQADTSPIGGGDWSGEYSGSFWPDLQPDNLLPWDIADANVWGAIYAGLFPAVESSPTGWYVPARIKMIRNSDSASSPWVVVFAEVENNT